MNPDLGTLVTALYVTVDDLSVAHPRWVPERPASGIAPVLSDAELVAMAALQALLGFDSEARFVRHAKEHLTAWFPYLPGRSGYNKRLRRSGDLMSRVMAASARDCLSWCDDVWLADSAPVECGRSRETQQRSDLAGRAECGYSASHSRWFWGLRLHPAAGARVDRRCLVATPGGSGGCDVAAGDGRCHDCEAPATPGGSGGCDCTQLRALVWTAVAWWSLPVVLGAATAPAGHAVGAARRRRAHRRQCRRTRHLPGLDHPQEPGAARPDPHRRQPEPPPGVVKNTPWRSTARRSSPTRATAAPPSRHNSTPWASPSSAPPRPENRHVPAGGSCGHCARAGVLVWWHRYPHVPAGVRGSYAIDGCHWRTSGSGAVAC